MANITEEKLAEEIRASLIDGYLPCPVAFQLAERLKLARHRVGTTANQMKIRISNCQLGCFTIEKAGMSPKDGQPVNETLAQQISSSLVNEHLPCASAFKISQRLEIEPADIRDAANKLKIKISNCQLGCF